MTEEASWRLGGFGEELGKRDPGSMLSKADVGKLFNLADRLWATLAAEATTKTVFVVTEKTLNVQRLLSDPRSLIGQEVFDKLSDLAQYDFTEACKCIAFERATAAAFHLMRATEDVLRHLYRSIVRRLGDRVDPLMWGPITDDLRRRSRKKGARKRVSHDLLDDLDRLRLRYRNPTQHPEKIYRIDEVQDMFGECMSVVRQMVKSPLRLKAP